MSDVAAVMVACMRGIVPSIKRDRLGRSVNVLQS